MNKACRLIAMLTLYLGVLLFPMAAFADAPPDSTPPKVSAYLDGGLLHVTATDDQSGVETVYIGGKPITCSGNATLVLNFGDYTDGNGSTSIYAVDFAGNKSAPVTVTKPGTENPDAPAGAESSTAKPTAPLAPKGIGTVIDHVTADSKEFYTIQTPDKNVFYLIIDHAANTQNVYFLNVVTEDDLFALTGTTKPDTDEESTAPNKTAGTIKPSDQPQPETTKEPTPVPETAKKSNTGTIVFIMLAAIILGSVGYYFKIVKPKKERAIMDDEDDEDDGDDDVYVNEDDSGSDYSGVPGDDSDYEFESEDEESETVEGLEKAKSEGNS